MSNDDSNAPLPVTLDESLQVFQPLRPAESVLLLALRAGAIARVGLRRPLVPSVDVTLRGEFVSALVRSRIGTRLEESNLEMIGAWIEGRIDLRDATVPRSLWFYRCVLDATPRLDGARIGGSVSFRGCLLPGLRAESCAFAEDLALNSGCTVRNEVRLARATIGRDLDCERLQLRSSERSPSPPRRRMLADGVRIDGDAILADGFRADGDVRFVGARIAGNLRADNAHLSGNISSSGERGDALNLDRVQVAGNVSLDRGFTAAGTVRMARARIDGDLDCTGAAFDVYGEAAFAGGVALLLDRARVSGSLLLARLRRPLVAASLLGARVGALLDDATTWGGRLALDGFAYSRFAAGAPTDAAFRLRWLAHQERGHLGRDFRPGPWSQVIAVLRRMGHDHAAKVIAIAHESHRRRIGRVGAGVPRLLRWLPRLGHALFGAFTGYGYRPLRIVSGMTIVWLACSGLYSAAAEEGAMAPTDPLVFDSPHYASCREQPATGAAQSGNWARCPQLPPEYPAFSPFAYSLDLLLPLMDLQQEQRWAALNDAAEPSLGTHATARHAWRVAARFMSSFEILFGWIASLTLIAAIAGVFNREHGR